MSGDDIVQPQVHNPYRAAIVSARDSSTGPADTLRTALDKAVTAMQAGAWVGGRADTFGADLEGLRSTARSAATNSIHEFNDAIGNQQAMVDANSWQVHWHNL